MTLLQRLHADDRGSPSVELLGMLPWLLLVALMVWQLLLVGFTVTAAQQAARDASRAASLGEDGEDAGLASLSSYLRTGVRTEIDGNRAEVTVPVPIVVPGVVSEGFAVSRSAEMPG